MFCMGMLEEHMEVQEETIINVMLSRKVYMQVHQTNFASLCKDTFFTYLF